MNLQVGMVANCALEATYSIPTLNHIHKYPLFPQSPSISAVLHLLGIHYITNGLLQPSEDQKLIISEVSIMLYFNIQN